MSANLFDVADRPNSQYISQFTGSTLKELDETGKVLDDRYRQNLENFTQLDMMASQMDVRDADKAIKDELLNNVRSTIDSVAKSNDGNFENATVRLSQLARDFVGNEARQAALYNRQEELRAKKLREQYGARALDFNPNLATSPTIDPETGQVRRFNAGIEERLDYDKRRQSFFDDILADASEGKFKASDLLGFLERGTYQGVSDTKIKKYLDNAFERYESTEEYDQELRKLTRIDGLTEKEAKSAMREALLATGREKVFNRTGNDITQDPIAIAANKRGLEAERNAILQTVYTPALQNGLLGENPLQSYKFDSSSGQVLPKESEYQGTTNEKGEKVYKIFKDPSGKVVGRGEATEKGVGGTQFQQYTLKDGFKEEELTASQMKQQVKSQIQNIRDQQSSYGYDLGAFSDEEIFNAYNNAWNKLKTVDALAPVISQDISKVLTDRIFGTNGIAGLSGRNTLIMDNQGKPVQGGTPTQVADALDISEEELQKRLKEAKISNVVGVNPYGVAGYTATIPNEDGKPINLMITGSNEMQAVFRRSQDLSKAAYTGQPAEHLGIINGQPVLYESRPVLNPRTQKFEVDVIAKSVLLDNFGNIQYNSSTGKPLTSEGILPLGLDKDGNNIYQKSLEQIQRSDLATFMSSGLLGGDLSATKNTSVE